MAKMPNTLDVEIKFSAEGMELIVGMARKVALLWAEKEFRCGNISRPEYDALVKDISEGN